MTSPSKIIPNGIDLFQITSHLGTCCWRPYSKQREKRTQQFTSPFNAKNDKNAYENIPCDRRKKMRIQEAQDSAHSFHIHAQWSTHWCLGTLSHTKIPNNYRMFMFIFTQTNARTRILFTWLNWAFELNTQSVPMFTSDTIPVDCSSADYWSVFITNGLRLRPSV